MYISIFSSFNLTKLSYTLLIMYSKKRHLAYQQLPQKIVVFDTLLPPVNNEYQRMVNGLTRKLEGQYGPIIDSIYYQCLSDKKCKATLRYIQQNVPNQK